MDSFVLIITISSALFCNASLSTDPSTGLNVEELHFVHLSTPPANDGRFVRKSPAVQQKPLPAEIVAEHPAMTEEERILSKHFPNKDDWDDSDYANSEDYDDDTDLDEAHFDKQLQEADEFDTQSPLFLQEPQSAFVRRGQSATLRCRAAHAMEV